MSREVTLGLFGDEMVPVMRSLCIEVGRKKGRNCKSLLNVMDRMVDFCGAHYPFFTDENGDEITHDVLEICRLAHLKATQPEMFS